MDTAIGLLGLAFVFWGQRGLAGGEELLDEKEFKVSLWNYSTDVRGGFGYKDNLLLSHANAQGSAFWMSSAEVMIFRLPTQGWQFNLFADATDVRYFNSTDVNDEQVALAVAQLSKDFGSGWKSTMGLNYMFQNQVYDFSATYTDEASVGLILGHSLTPRWALRKTIGSLWVEGELNGTRQWLDEPLDNYWQFGPRVSVGLKWERGTELAFSYQYGRLDYDNREQVDDLGATIPDTSLALNIHAAELAFTHVWDEQGHWRTITALGFGASLDNGSGFYDYEEYRLSQQLRYRRDKWEITARAKVGRYNYSNQTVSATDTDLRRKTALAVTLRLERTLAKHLKAYAAYNWDNSISNLEFDDYQANVVTGGLVLVF